MTENFRMLYYDQLGLRNVDQKKTLEQLLSEDPLDQGKLRNFSQQFMLPVIYRSWIWKVLLGILPTFKESNDFVARQRRGQFEDLKQALITMRMISSNGENSDQAPKQHRTIVLMYLLNHGLLSVLSKNIIMKDGNKMCKLESISQIVCEIISDECDAFWISKCLYDAQEKFNGLFEKLPKYVTYYLQLEDQRLYEHLCEINLFKTLPYNTWFCTYFAFVFEERLDYLEKVLDKLVAGSCNILVFICVALLLTFSIKLKEMTSPEDALKLISHLSEDMGLAVIDKTMELWDQHRKSLSMEIGCP